MMIWLNIKKLETKLVLGEVTEKASLQYLLIYLVLVTVLLQISITNEFPYTGWEISDLILGLLITITGTYFTFSINSKRDDRDFLKRYLSLSFVHGLRLIVLLMILHLIYKIIMFIIPLNLYLFFNDMFTGDFPELLYSIVISLIFYFLLIRSFKRINGAVHARKVSA